MSNRRRIVLTTFGSFGDIHPFMAIAIELQARGHIAVIATSSLYQEKIENAGLNFTAVAPNLPPPREQDQTLMDRIMEPKSGPKFLLELLLPSLRESYQDLISATAGAHLLINHPIMLAAQLAARKTGIPWISTALAPMSFFSAYDPPVLPFWPFLRHCNMFGPVFMRAVFALMQQQYRPKQFDELRKGLAISDYGNPIFAGQHSPSLSLALFSPLFAPPQRDWPSQTKITGFPFYDSHSKLEMPAELVRFLDEGPAPIIFTLGSSAVWVARDFFHQSIAATKKIGCRAVLLVGDERNMPQESLPAGVLAVNYAPYEILLSRACAMIHHGGVGTTSQGLRAGVPTLIVPFAFDQSDNAAHAHRLGTSRTLQRHQYVAARVARELELLLREPQYAKKARWVSEHLQKEKGAAVAGDLIEQFLDGSTNIEEQHAESLYASRN